MLRSFSGRHLVPAVALSLLAACGGDGAVGDAAGPGLDASVDAAGPALCVDGAAPLVPSESAERLAAARAACGFAAGARVAESLGLTAEARARLPVDHVIVVMQENRSFDHYFGSRDGEVDGIPAGYSNPNARGEAVRPTHLASTCVAFDPPHQWAAMHTGWNLGHMDGFVRASGLSMGEAVVLGYYEPRDLPFYDWLYRTFAMSDRHFGSVLGGTWSNRNFLYTGSSYGVRNTGERTIPQARTIFDTLDAAGVAWAVFSDGAPRQDSLGWTRGHRGFAPTSRFFEGLRDGTLPPVVFVDPAGDVDEHPTGDVQRGEAWARSIVTTALSSPLWPRLALVLTYDESGGFFDHVAPPSACSPDPDGAGGYDVTDLDRFGVRVPFVLVSPWARPSYVSHLATDHTAVLRFIEALYDLPALTGRDANASALLDMFDFSCPQLREVHTEIPAAGRGGCHGAPMP